MSFYQKKYSKILKEKFSHQELIDAVLYLADNGLKLESWLFNLSTPKNEIINNFHSKLSQLKSRKVYFPWKESQDFNEYISEILNDLEMGSFDAKDVLINLKIFFEHDDCIVESTHEISASPFLDTTKDLFIKYANQIEDKEFVFNTAMEILEVDEYGIKVCLLSNMHLYLPEDFLREKIKLKILDNFYIQELACNLKDPLLLIESLDEEQLSLDHYKITLAVLYFEAGDKLKALDYLEQVKDHSDWSENTLKELRKLK